MSFKSCCSSIPSCLSLRRTRAFAQRGRNKSVSATFGLCNSDRLEVSCFFISDWLKAMALCGVYMSKYTADLTDARWWYFMVYESYLHKTIKKKLVDRQNYAQCSSKKIIEDDEDAFWNLVSEKTKQRVVYLLYCLWRKKAENNNMYPYSFKPAWANAVRICQRQSEVRADGTETERDGL